MHFQKPPLDTADLPPTGVGYLRTIVNTPLTAAAYSLTAVDYSST